MSLYKSGYVSLLVGIVLLVVSIFFTTDWNLGAWLTLFIASIIICTVGIILLIVHLIKQIKADKIRKMHQ